MSMEVHQAAKFSNNHKNSYDTAAKRTCKRLLNTSNDGLMCKPDASKGLEAFVDADFAGCFDDNVAEDPASVHSRTGFIIKHGGCPVTWKSKLQSEIALSTTEAECIALSTALRDTMSIMQLLRELGVVMNIPDYKKTMKCAVFEDNNGALELVTAPKMRLRTKHVAIKYHHFRNFLQDY